MKRRYELSKFDFAEADAIAEHLEAMAAKGWLLEAAGPYLWSYRKSEPKALRYTVGYLPGPHTAAPLPPEDLAAFRDRYRASGWEFAAEWYFVQIFCTDRDDAELPAKDERVKYYALRRSIGKQMWINAMVAALIALLLGIAIFAFRRNPLQACSSNTTLLAPWILLAALIAVVAPIIRYGFWSRRAAKAVNSGGRCPWLGNRHRRFWNAVLWLILLLFLAAILSDTVITGAVWEFLRYVVWLVGLMAIASLTGWVRRRGGSRGTFWAVWAVGVVVFLIVYLNLPEDHRSITVPREELPLSVEDLGYDAESDATCTLQTFQSVLLRRTIGREQFGDDSLYYTIYEPKTAWLRNICREDAESYLIWEPYADGIWIATEDELYHMPYLAYLIETEEALIYLSPLEPLDTDQLAAAISLLNP